LSSLKFSAKYANSGERGVVFCGVLAMAYLAHLATILMLLLIQAALLEDVVFD
jgi:hypothetical protein